MTGLRSDQIVGSRRWEGGGFYRKATGLRTQAHGAGHQSTDIRLRHEERKEPASILAQALPALHQVCEHVLVVDGDLWARKRASQP